MNFINKHRLYNSIILLSVCGLFFVSIVKTDAAVGKILAVHPGESIQEAINKAKSGTIILVSPGIYYEKIRLKKGITLRSEAGATATIIDAQNSSKPAITTASQCVIEGFTITGKGASLKESAPSHTIECINVSPLIKNNIIKNNQGTGIYISGVAASPEIIGNSIYSNSGAGIGNDNKSSAKIRNNKCYGNLRAGIGIHLQAAPIVDNNRLYNNAMAGIGIQHKNTSPTITNNQCYSNKLSGIGVEEGASPTLEGNHIYGNGRAGVGIRKESQVTIKGNTITGNTLSGIGILDKCKVTIINNTLNRNIMAGITVNDGSETDILNNTIQANGTQGIVCNFSKVIIQNNTISDNYHHGVAIYRFSHAQINNNTFINNGADDHRGAGIIVVSSNDVNINHNWFENNYGPGVYSRRSSPLIEHNEFANDLIFVKYFASPTIANNIFYSGKKSSGKKYKSGIDIMDKSSPIVVNNQFLGKFAIAIRHGSKPLIIKNIFSGDHKSSVKSGRSGIKVDKESLPSIKQNIFYNGNKIIAGGRSVFTNGKLVKIRNKFKPLKKQKISAKSKNLILEIADNLFLK